MGVTKRRVHGVTPPPWAWIRVSDLLGTEHLLTVQPGGKCPSEQDVGSELTPQLHLREAAPLLHLAGSCWWRSVERTSGPWAIRTSHTCFTVKSIPWSSVMLGGTRSE